MQNFKKSKKILKYLNYLICVNIYDIYRLRYIFCVEIACMVNNFCKGLCYKTPKGDVCGCPYGYRLAADATSCEDINECENDVCSQFCRNTVGSFECSCQEGYYLRNKVSCKAIGKWFQLNICKLKYLKQ